MTRNRLYLLFFTGIIAGYSWLIWSLWHYGKHNEITPCLFKNITGVACPSCGSTRSVMELSKGNITDALLINPLGIVITAIMLILPFWLLYDVALNKDSLHKSYLQFENTLRIKIVAIILILLIIANWAWNIHKGL